MSLQEEGGQFYEFYGSARRMQHITFESDPNYVGEDGVIDTGDEGRSLVMLAYEDIPFRLEQGTKSFLLGDNFKFDAILANPWNLAASLNVDSNLPEMFKSSLETPEGSNDIAYQIGSLADGEFNLQDIYFEC